MSANILPPESWAEMRAKFECGGYTMEALAKEYGTTGQTIKRHIVAENWRKGSLKEKLLIDKRRTFHEILLSKGMDKQWRLDLVIKGCTEPMVVIFEGKGDQMMATPEPDWKTRQKYIDMLINMVGEYAPVVREITGKGGGPIEFYQTQYDFSKLSSDELRVLRDLLGRCVKIEDKNEIPPLILSETKALPAQTGEVIDDAE